MIVDIKRPENWMENPYIGRDGRDYHTYEALQSANAEFDRVRNQPIPRDRKFLVTKVEDRKGLVTRI